MPLPRMVTEKLAEMALDSGPKTQDSIEPDYNSPIDIAAGAVGAGLAPAAIEGANAISSAIAKDNAMLAGNEAGAIGYNIKNVIYPNTVESASTDAIANAAPATATQVGKAERVAKNLTPIKDTMGNIIEGEGSLGSNPNATEHDLSHIKAAKKARDEDRLKNRLIPPSKRKPMLAEGGEVDEWPEPSADDKFADNYSTTLMANGGDVAPPGLDEFINSPKSIPKVDNSDTNQTIPTESQQAEAPEGLDEFLGEESPTQQKYGGLEQQAKTFLEGAAEGVAGPLATGAERLGGVSQEDLRNRRDVNPITHAAGQIAGLTGSMLTGVGEGALMAKAGAATAAKLGGETVAAKMGSAAVQTAIENMILASGDEATKMIIQDPNQTVQSAIQDVGLSGVLGGVLGAGSSGVGGLWKAKFGNKIGDMAADFKGRMQEHYANPDPLSTATEELHNLYTNITSHADEVYGPNGLKAQDIEKALPKKVSAKILSHSQQVSNDLSETIKKMRSKPYNYPKRLVSKLEDDFTAYKSATERPDVTSADLFNATQDLKQQMQGYAKFEKRITPFDEGYDFVRDAKKISHELRTQLENTSIFGKAAQRQQAINKAFTEFLPSLKDFQSKFMSKVNGEHVIDPGKVNTFMNQIDKPSGKLRREMLDNFVNDSNKYLNVISDTHHNLGIESPVEHTPLNVIKGMTEQKSLGAKLADYFIEKGQKDGFGEGVKGGLAGAAIGSLIGHPHLGALVGGHGSVINLLKSALPALIKPLIDSEAKPSALKSAVDYTIAAVKGDNAISKAAKSVFKVGEVSIAHNANRELQLRNKLDKQITEIQEDPKSMADIGKDLGHYMPNHNVAIASTSMNAVNYLNSLKPNSVKMAPLDPKFIPSSTAKARYNSALDIANNPMLVMDKIRSGTITSNDIKDLNVMYPNLYDRMSTKLLKEMNDHITKGDTVPYKTRLGLSMFLGQGMDSTITPMAIMSAQPVPQSSPQNNQGNANKAKKNTKPLSKAPSEYRTPGQNRELNKQTKD